MILRLLVTSFLFLSACSTTVKMPSASPNIKKSPMEAWTEVLKKYVNDKGEVNFEGLRDNRADLDHYVAYVSSYDPSSLDIKTKIAHHVNAYNALSMYAILAADIPESLSGFKKVKFFYFTKMTIGGQVMSLYTYENEIIRKLGDERIHFALNCMSVGCPRLPQKPFTGAKLDQEFEAEALEFFAEERNYRIDHANKTVYLSEILDFFPEDFKARSGTLIKYANIYAKEKTPEDYKVKFTPYDWTVNNSNRHNKK